VLLLSVGILGADKRSKTAYRDSTPYEKLEQLKMESMQTASTALSMAYTAGYFQGQLECNTQETKGE